MNKVTQLVVRRFKGNPILLILVLFAVVSIFFAPNFRTFYNLRTILLQSCVLGIVATGVMFVVLNGGIDFSCTSVIALSSVIGASVMTSEGGLLHGSPFAIPVAILMMMLIGVGFGVINGISVTIFKMPSFIVTLAMMMIGSGIAVWYTDSETIFALPERFLVIGNGTVIGIPIPVLFLIVVFVIATFILTKTKLGRLIYLIGTNHKASYISGLPVKKTIFFLFIISGLLSGIGSIVMTARLQTGAPGHGSNMFLDIIASIIIGGASLYGGKGKASGTLLGAIFIIMMNNGLNLMGVQWHLINIIKGLVILAAAVSDFVQNRKSLDR